MNIEERIAQWQNMTQADPDNDMGWFSLGNAYKDADRLEDAQHALAKAIELNEGMSRAYQLRGQVLIQLGRNKDAQQVLTTGYVQAAQRGDVMPQKAIGSLLERIGAPVPDVESKGSVAEELSGDEIIDRRTGRPDTRLPDPPMRGPLGQFIFEHYGQETWREWIGQGTKVINELRLDFSNEQHQQIYEQHMKEWLGISEEDLHAAAEQQ